MSEAIGHDYDDFDPIPPLFQNVCSYHKDGYVLDNGDFLWLDTGAIVRVPALGGNPVPSREPLSEHYGLAERFFVNSEGSRLAIAYRKTYDLVFYCFSEGKWIKQRSECFWGGPLILGNKTDFVLKQPKAVECGSILERIRMDKHRGLLARQCTMSADGSVLVEPHPNGFEVTHDLQKEHSPVTRYQERDFAQSVDRMSLSPNGAFLAIVNKNKEVRVFDTAVPRVVCHVKVHEVVSGLINSVAVNNTGDSFAVTSLPRNVVHVFDREDSRKWQILGDASTVEFLSNGWLVGHCGVGAPPKNRTKVWKPYQ